MRLRRLQKGQIWVRKTIEPAGMPLHAGSFGPVKQIWQSVIIASDPYEFRRMVVVDAILPNGRTRQFVEKIIIDATEVWRFVA